MNWNFANLAKRYLVADTPALHFRERVKSALGAALGVLVVFLTTYLLVSHEYVMLAAVGATAIILFSMPHSPMAQPWSVMGGYVLALLVAWSVLHLELNPIAGTTLAIALVVLLSMTFKCVHPPAGAVAIFVYSQGPYGLSGLFGIAPGILMSALMVLFAALALNNILLGRKYPQCQPELPVNQHKTKDLLPIARAGVMHEDLAYALESHGTFVDIQESELVDLYDTAINHAFARKMNTLCGDIMAKDVISVRQQTAMDHAWSLLHKHKIKALPVVNEQQHILGIVTVADFLKDIASRGHDRLLGLEKLISGQDSQSGKERPVSEIMTLKVVTAEVNTPVSELIKRLSDLGLHHVPIVDAQQRLVGMITQSDLIASMYQKIVLGSR